MKEAPAMSLSRRQEPEELVVYLTRQCRGVEVTFTVLPIGPFAKPC